jgi:hypothetical protein
MNQDVARIDLKKEDLETPVDQFNIEISKVPDNGGILTMKWEKTAFSIPFTVQKKSGIGLCPRRSKERLCLTRSQVEVPMWFFWSPLAGA